VSAFSEATAIAQRRRVLDQMTDLEYVQNFKACLDKFSETCILCTLTGIHTAFHNIMYCPTLQKYNNNTGTAMFKAFKEKIKYGMQHRKICYMCHIPQGPNDLLHPKFQGKNGKCSRPDLLLPLAFGLFHFKQITSNSAHKMVQTRFSTEFELISYLNDDPEQNQPSNLVFIFLMFAKEY
jgi:hypothetical protein